MTSSATSSPLPSFSLGINLDDWLACHNFSLAGKVASVEAANLITPGMGISVKTMDLDTLRRHEVSLGALSPRCANRIMVPLESTGKLDSMGEIELAFEAQRRILAPHSPSRLSCMWLAEDSEAGRSHIRTMFSTIPHLLVVKVRVTCALAFFKADTGWFDRYVRNADETFIKNYWSGLNCPNGAWEFLLDGGVELIDSVNLANIRANGAKLPPHSP